MRQKTALVFALITVLAAILPASATAQNPVRFSIGGGFTMPNSEVRDRLGDGYNFTIGLDFVVTPVVSIEGQYSFNGLGEKRISIPLSPSPGEDGVPTDFFADMNMQYGTASVVFQTPEGDIRPYGLTGMGIYYRPIQVTTPGVGWAPGYCDPWWYICYPGGWVPVDVIVGERSTTDFGMVFGGGVKLGPAFAEIRYHYIWGPTIDGEVPSNPIAGDPSGTDSLAGKSADGQYLTTTFGFRF